MRKFFKEIYSDVYTKEPNSWIHNFGKVRFMDENNILAKKKKKTLIDVQNGLNFISGSTTPAEN